MARHLYEQVPGFRQGPVDQGPYMFVAADACGMITVSVMRPPVDASPERSLLS